MPTTGPGIVIVAWSALSSPASPTSSLMRKGWLPESLTRRVVVRPFALLSRGVAGFSSEWWPASNRNPGRHQFGIPGRNASESAARSLCDSARPRNSVRPSTIGVCIQLNTRTDFFCLGGSNLTTKPLPTRGVSEGRVALFYTLAMKRAESWPRSPGLLKSGALFSTTTNCPR